MKKHEAANRAVFVKTFDFYLDCLKKSAYNKVLAALDEEIQALKRQMEASTKIELDTISNFQEFMSSPDQHFQSVKELTDKLTQAEKELEEADKKFKLMEANVNRLLIDQQNSLKETSNKLV